MNVDVRNPFIWTVLLAVTFAACGGETEADGTGGTGGTAAGGNQASGGESGSGGSGVGGGAQSGGGDAGGSSSGGADTGGASTGGVVASGGGDGSGGSINGTGGSWTGCDCDAPSVPVCGSDGQTYDAGCGEQCVPVVIACEGECPCAEPSECDCHIEGYDNCYEDAPVRWLCTGPDHSGANALEQGCEGLPTGLERYCCPSSVTASVFCPE